MGNPTPAVLFDKKAATSYDKQRAKLAPLGDALHLFMRLVLSDLPVNARVLCVGVGTGAELLYLAQAFPTWHFTAIEPAGPMLDICRQKAEGLGIAERCTFHEGYLSSFPPAAPFDAATAILVSHFFMQPDERSAFFLEIADRLKPGGLLVNADLASDMASPAFDHLLDVWISMLKYSDIPSEDVKKFSTACGRKVAVLAPQTVENIIRSGGFGAPVLFFQSLLTHAWFSRTPC